MPTKRAWVLGVAALIFYFLANQTQVGWLYIFTNGLLGFLIAAFLYGWGLLKSIRVSRLVWPAPADGGDEVIPDLIDAAPAFHEDDAVNITLSVSQPRLRPAFLISGQESCPFAPPTAQAQPLFIPSLFKRRPAELTYQTTCDRRGLFSFPPLSLHSHGPFGLFRARHIVNAPTEILIYPAYHPLRRLRIFEKHAFAERQVRRAGHSSQVIGTRDYRPGDSLRQIHWRSTARTGDLIVKEFAADEDLTLSVVLDLSEGGSLGAGKYSTFETALRIAASLSYYADHNNLPFRLIGASPSWAPPGTPLSWWASLNYLARVQNDGQAPLEQVVGRLKAWSFLIVLASNPNPQIGATLASLGRQGVQVLPIFITPQGDLPAGMKPVQPAVVVSPHNWAATLAQV